MLCPSHWIWFRMLIPEYERRHNDTNILYDNARAGQAITCRKRQSLGASAAYCISLYGCGAIYDSWDVSSDISGEMEGRKNEEVKSP